MRKSRIPSARTRHKTKATHTTKRVGKRAPAKATTYSKSFPPKRPSLQTYKIHDMRHIFQACGISLSTEEEVKTWKHYKLLARWNQIHNLTRIRDFKDIMIKHYVDSFLVANLVDLPESLLDIGTGPGFPGIPLKIVRPQIHLILAERIQKRVLFLAEVKKKLGLANVEIIGRRIDKNFSEPVNGVITRALGSIAETLPKLAGCLLPGGVVLFMKGPKVDEEIKKAQRIIEGRYLLEKDTAYTLPIKGHKRRLLTFRRL
jgi:16S rRNA (guanine527-N7)-methyltransferase